MENRQDTSSFKAISKAIRQKRKQKRKTKQRQMIVVLVFVVVINLLMYGLYKLDQSSLFRISKIIVNHNELYEDDVILDTLNLHAGKRTWLVHPILYKNKTHDLAGIESLTLRKKGRLLFVDVEEFKVLGFKANHFLIDGGSLIQITDFNRHLQKHVPEIIGFDDEELLERLSESLMKLKPEILMLIASLNQLTTTYDQAQVWMLLNDKKQVFSDFRAVELFNNYPLFVDQISPENDCIYLDYTSSSARSSPCQ